MRLSFDEWLSIWKTSGHLHERGKGAGKYVMSRINDLGHYELGNVCIKLHVDNIREGIALHYNRPITMPVIRAVTKDHSHIYYGVHFMYDLALRKDRHFRKHSLTDDQLLSIIPRHENGEAWTSISEDYQVSSDTIRQTIYEIRYSVYLPR